MKTTQKKAEKKPGVKQQHQKATLAGGCFWCVEADLEKLDGVQEVVSGYAGGRTVNPSYKEVSSGVTGHLEVVQVIFNPEKISYSELLDVFWRSINPLDEKGQFVDRGHQYSTAVFYHNEEQKKIAERSKKELEEKGPFKKKIVTPILALKSFYKAEDYHQDYYKKNSLKYKYYRYRSGRDQFLKRTWGDFKDFLSLPSFKGKKGKKPDPEKSDSQKSSEVKGFAKKAVSAAQKSDPQKSSEAKGFAKKAVSAEQKSDLKKHSEVKEKEGASEENKQSRPEPSDRGEKGQGNPYFRPSEKEIRKKLTKLQYRVTQEDATEPPFKNLYWDHKKEGIYVDIVSGEALFSSLDKYDSGTGWPSFTQPLAPSNIVTKKDRKYFMTRTEVRSKYGDSHLGHLFKDGPPPTGLRYCINSAALRFIPKDQLQKEGYSAFISLFP